MKRILYFAVFTVFVLNQAVAQYTTLNAHSHNDYEQPTPFFMAYNARFGSIEADVWAIDGELYVAHDKKEIVQERTLEKLYLIPISKLFKENKGKPWADNDYTFQLLIDLKTPVEPTLSILVKKLEQFQEVFNPAVNRNAVRIVITGNRPAPEKFNLYADFIFFDGILNQSYTENQIQRVPLFSENMAKFSRWKENGKILAAEETKLKQVVDSVHETGGKIRFWNAPDNSQGWDKLIYLKVDYLNTDHIQELSGFLQKFNQSK